MILTLTRTYHSAGTNGDISIDGVRLCHSIELPWKNNQPGISCVPEGVYALAHRWSPRHGSHLLVKDVPGRSLILLHPANNAAKELKGCIAPVTRLTGPGRGDFSRLALKSLLQLIAELAADEPLSLLIRSEKP